MIHVACSSDARFAPDCAAMLASLMAANPGQDLFVHLMQDESLSRSEVDSLRAIVVDAGGAFESVPVNGGRATALAKSERFPARVWFRVILPDLLPDLPRVLYMDVDALVTAPLAPLWDTDLGGHLIGAITNPLYRSMVPRIRTELGLPGGAAYFNSGVLLMDLEAWRAEDASGEVVRFAGAHPALIWPDQDALNGALHERRMHLHPRWNAMPGIWALPPRYLPYPSAQIQEAASEPAIVHFVGDHKPWHYRCRHPYRSEYFRRLEGTPWHGRPIEGRSSWQAVLRRLPTVWAYRVEVALARSQRSIGAARGHLRAVASRPS